MPGGNGYLHSFQIESHFLKIALSKIERQYVLDKICSDLITMQLGNYQKYSRPEIILAFNLQLAKMFDKEKVKTLPLGGVELSTRCLSAEHLRPLSHLDKLM